MSFMNNSPLELHSADLANFECSQTLSLVSSLKTKFPRKFAKNSESQTENPSVVDLLHESSEKNKIKSLLKFLLLFAFAKSRISLFSHHCEAHRRFAEAIHTKSSLRDLMILYIQNNSSICGGDFVFARIFGIKTRLESVESQKFLQVRKKSPKTSEAKFPVKTNCPHPQRLNLAF